MKKPCTPDTLLAVAQNGQMLEHLHGAPVRLLVPGLVGNWSVKWLWKLEVLDHEPDCWYHYNFYYYGDSPDDPNKELITTIGVKSMVTQPNDDTDTLPEVPMWSAVTPGAAAGLSPRWKYRWTGAAPGNPRAWRSPSTVGCGSAGPTFGTLTSQANTR